MGLEVPIPVSMKLGDNNNLFRSIVEAAHRPHLSIPETELGKSTKQHRHLIQRSLGYAVGMLFELGHCPYTLYGVIAARQKYDAI